MLNVFIKHEITLFIGYHLKREFVMISKKNCPLGICRNIISLLQNIDKSFAFFFCKRYIDSRHEREIKCHMKFISIAFAKIRYSFIYPLICFSKKDFPWILNIKYFSYIFKKCMGFRKILAIGPLTLVKVRYC